MRRLVALSLAVLTALMWSGGTRAEASPIPIEICELVVNLAGSTLVCRIVWVPQSQDPEGDGNAAVSAEEPPPGCIPVDEGDVRKGCLVPNVPAQAGQAPIDLPGAAARAAASLAIPQPVMHVGPDPRNNK